MKGHLTPEAAEKVLAAIQGSLDGPFGVRLKLDVSGGESTFPTFFEERVQWWLKVTPVVIDRHGDELIAFDTSVSLPISSEKSEWVIDLDGIVGTSLAGLLGFNAG